MSDPTKRQNQRSVLQRFHACPLVPFLPPLLMPQNTVETFRHFFFPGKSSDKCRQAQARLTGTRGLSHSCLRERLRGAPMDSSTKRKTENALHPQQDRCVVTCRLRRNTFLPGEQILGTVKFEVSCQDQEYIDIEEVQRLPEYIAQ